MSYPSLQTAFTIAYWSEIALLICSILLLNALITQKRKRRNDKRLFEAAIDAVIKNREITEKAADTFRAKGTVLAEDFAAERERYKSLTKEACAIMLRNALLTKILKHVYPVSSCFVGSEEKLHAHLESLEKKSHERRKAKRRRKKEAPLEVA